jgi:hypothetical protein
VPGSRPSRRRREIRLKLALQGLDFCRPTLTCVQWAKGTHSGEFRGFPVKTSVVAPTGRPVTFSANDIYLIENGLVVTEWNSLAPVDVLQQVGAVTLQV